MHYLKVGTPRVCPALRVSVLFLFGLIVWLLAGSVLADTLDAAHIDWLNLGMGLFGGLALFLLGIDRLSVALREAAGEQLKVLLASFTEPRIKGALTGALVTALLNSSTVTTVLLVGFVSAGVMTLAQSVPMIFGANVGSTVTAQIVAFDVAAYSLAMIAVGFAGRLLARTDRSGHYADMLIGLGLLFFGMGLIGDAMAPLRSFPPFLELMVQMRNPLLGLLVGFGFTVVVNSSAATIGVAIVMATEGLITLEAGIALALGANIGTIVTTLIVSIGRSRDAVRTAWVHGLFNIIGPLLWLPFIPQLAEIATWMSPSHPDLEGTARMAEEVPRQIANAHTVLNMINALICLPLTPVFVRVVTRMFPDRPVTPEKSIIEPEFLSEELVDTPTLALDRVRLELGRLGKIVVEMLERARHAYQERDLSILAEVEKMDDQVDLLHDSIVRYLGEVRGNDLSDEQEELFVRFLSVTADFEALADLIETDLVGLGREALAQEAFKVSETMRELMTDLHSLLVEALNAAILAVEEDDPRKAQDVMAAKEPVRLTIDHALHHQAAGLRGGGDAQRLARLRIEMEYLDKMERIYRLTRRIAKTVLPSVLLVEQVS